MTLTSGQRLGPYEIVEGIGAGGMGEVYRARDTRLDRIVAIKVVNAEWSNREEGQRRFEREAHAIARVSHPNVCALYDVGRADDHEFLVMEWVEGESLAARLARGPVPLRELVHVAQGMAHGLDAAHRQGVVHRDFKPGNVIVSRTGVKVLDFGLARALKDEPVHDAVTKPVTTTAPGTIVGTLPYMAPEQVRGLHSDARSDVFALGAVLYEMATGRRAFPASRPADLVSEVLTAEPPPPSSLRTGVPAPLERLIAQCLEKDPEARPQTAGEVARALSLVTDVPSGTSAAAAPVRRLVRPWLERLAWAATVAAALTLLSLQARRAPGPNAAVPPALLRFEIPLPQGSLFKEVVDIDSAVAVSPNGRYVVFPLLTGDVWQLWLHDLSNMRTRPLRGTEGARGPFWSPSSRHVAFFAGGSIKRVAVDGEIVEQVCAAPVPTFAGTWGVDDSILFADVGVRAVMRVSAVGGTPEPVTSLPGRGVIWPVFLPDGRRYLLASRQGLSIGDVVAKTLTPIGDVRTLAMYARSGHLLHVRDGALVAQPFDVARGRITGDATVLAEPVQYFVRTAGAAFSVSDAGTIVYRPATTAPRRIAWVRRDGTGLIDAAPAAPWVFAPRLSPDGTKLTAGQYVQASGTTDLWVHDLRTNTPVRMTADTEVDNWPTWWPDGQSNVFSRDEGESPPALVRKAITDASPGPLKPLVPASSSTLQYSAAVAPDGKAVAYGAGGDIWLWRVGASAPEPLIQTRGGAGGPAFSPDGRWLAYESAASGRTEVYVRPFGRAGDEIRVSTAGGSAPRWCQDGLEIFFIEPSGDLAAVSLVLADGVRSGTPQRVAPGLKVISFDVARDGRLLVQIQAQEAERSTLHVILNWVGMSP